MKKSIIIAAFAAACALAITSLSSDADRMSPQGGTITSVTAGTGLTGGATGGPATLNVGCGAGISCAPDSIAADTTVMQSRVSGTCASPSAITSILANGTVTCSTGGGVSGTTNTIAKFDSPTSVADSSITDDGTTVAIGEPVSVSGSLSSTTSGTGVPIAAFYSGTNQGGGRTTLYAADTGTFDTSGGDLTTYGLYSNMTASRSVGANNLTGVAIFGTASGAQVNTALQTDNGDVILNRLGGTASLMGATTITSATGSTPLTVAEAHAGQTGDSTLVSLLDTGTFDNTAADRQVKGLLVTLASPATDFTHAVNRTAVSANADTGGGAGSGDINIGLEASATGGATNYAIHATNGDVLIDNDASIVGTLGVGGTATFNGLLNVDSLSTFNSPATFNDELDASTVVVSTSLTLGQLYLGVASVATAGGMLDNWSPGGLSSATQVRIGTAGVLADLTGLTGGVPGRQLTLTNAGPDPVRIWDESSGMAGGSTSSNRFMLGTTNIGIGPGDSATFVYDGTSSRWRLVSQSRAPNAYGGTHYEWTDEFINGAIPGSGTDLLTCANGGTGSSCGNSGSGFRLGAARFDTGTTSTGRAGVITATILADFGAGSWVWEGTFGWATLSDATDGFASVLGFYDVSSGINQTDGCWFQYDNQNAATGPSIGNASSATTNKLECWCASNTSRTGYIMDGVTLSDGSFTTVDTPVAAYSAPDTNIMRGMIVMTGSAKAEFFVDTGGGYTKRCQITTNIPSGITRATGVGVNTFKNVGTTSTTLQLDQMRWAVDLNSVRSP